MPCCRPTIRSLRCTSHFSSTHCSLHQSHQRSPLVSKTRRRRLSTPTARPCRSAALPPAVDAGPARLPAAVPGRPHASPRGKRTPWRAGAGPSAPSRRRCLWYWCRVGRGGVSALALDRRTDVLQRFRRQQRRRGAARIMSRHSLGRLPSMYSAPYAFSHYCTWRLNADKGDTWFDFRAETVAPSVRACLHRYSRHWIYIYYTYIPHSSPCSIHERSIKLVYDADGTNSHELCLFPFTMSTVSRSDRSYCRPTARHCFFFQ